MDTNKEVNEFYKNWCKKTKRSGGVLVGSSIKELLISFYEFIKEGQEILPENCLHERIGSHGMTSGSYCKDCGEEF